MWSIILLTFITAVTSQSTPSCVDLHLQKCDFEGRAKCCIGNNPRTYAICQKYENLGNFYVITECGNEIEYCEDTESGRGVLCIDVVVVDTNS